MITAIECHPNILGGKIDGENIFLTFCYRAGYPKKRMRNKHVLKDPLLSPSPYGKRTDFHKRCSSDTLMGSHFYCCLSLRDN